MAAVFLRTDVGHVLIGNRRPPATDEPTSLSIRVGLVSTSTEPCQVLEAGHDFQHGADPGKVGQRLRNLGDFIDP